MENFDQNAAKRLFSLIQNFKRLATNDGYGLLTSLAVWGKVFQVEEVHVMEKIGEIFYLIKSIQNTVLHEPGIRGKKSHLKWIDPMRGAFSAGKLVRSASELAHNEFADSHPIMVGLDFCVEALSETHPEVEIPEPDLTTLRSECSALIDEVQRSASSPELQRFLMELLRGFSDGLNSYQIQGVSGLDNALDVAIGRLVKYKSNKNLKPATDTDQSMVERFSIFFKKAAATADAAKKIKDGAALGYESFTQIANSISSIS